jgi:hypothetical protein
MKNFFSSKKFVSTAALLAIVASSQASAAIAPNITFGGVDAGDDSGLTSGKLLDPSHVNNSGANGFFVETFDQATAVDGAAGPGDTQYNEGPNSDTCAVNGVGGGIVVNTSMTNGPFGVRKGSVDNVAAQPLDDNTCYGHTPAEGGDIPSWVEIDYTAFLAAQGDVGITYLGFYWGSVDTYNDFTFYSEGEEIGSILGTDLLAASDADSGDQTDPDSNRYVNIDFAFADAFDTVRISTNGIAGEFDNIVIGLANRPVPAPAGLAFLGLGLLGLSFSRKFKK